jgi:hypothetical protein
VTNDSFERLLLVLRNSPAKAAVKHQTIDCGIAEEHARQQRHQQVLCRI